MKLKKNSIYLKLLIPILCIMLIQTFLISGVLFVNGTVTSLQDGAIDSMRKNMENRSITLENMMVRSWSNISRFETETRNKILEYTEENGISVHEALSDAGHAKQILNSICGAALNSLRLSASTGIFIYFTDGKIDAESHVFRGLYFRDLNPFSTPADYSDVQCLRGSYDIANTHKISLDSLWNETFELSPADAAGWESYVKPADAARRNPGLDSANLSYWSKSRLITANSTLDANPCITYTRPLLLNGEIIAMIGTEVQSKHITSYFPYTDFGISGQGGYMLARYDAAKQSNNQVEYDIFEVTGSYIQRLLGTRRQIDFIKSSRDNVYNFEDKSFEASQMVYSSLKLYNANTPFSTEQWVLAAIETDAMLFEASNRVLTGIISSSVVAFIAGVVLMLFVIRSLTRPLAGIVTQIEKNPPYEPIKGKQTTYELSMLCQTLNEMKKKRKDMDSALKEERERYLVALESATDTFIEYDIFEDRFLVYYFSGSSKDNPASQTIENFMHKLDEGSLFHKSDIEKLKTFFTTETNDYIEVRVSTGLFNHLKQSESDAGYYWIALKASYIHGEEGAIKKIIGNARQITAEKLKENALLEANKRDTTTGLYNAEYGMALIENLLNGSHGGLFSVCCIKIENFRQYEARYGRVFAGLILRNYCRSLFEVFGADAAAVRLGNDEIYVLLQDVAPQEATVLVEKFIKKASSLYVGENKEAVIKFCVGISAGITPESSGNQFANAARAMQLAPENGMSLFNTDMMPAKSQKPIAGDIAVSAGANQAAVMSASEKQAVPALSVNEAQAPGTAVSVNLDISKNNIVSLAFELLESTSDKKSAINALIGVLGELFNLNQVFVCGYDTDFDSNQITHQWSAEGFSKRSEKIDKIPREDFEFLLGLLNANGTFVYGESFDAYSAGVKLLLCAEEKENFSAFCCSLYENGLHSGRMIFKSNPDRRWLEEDIYSLGEVAKIISAHINIEKSNSASKAKSEFLSRMSHEIRTPMNAIIGMTEIVKEKIDDHGRAMDGLKKIEFSAKHLLSLINDILDMSRIESGKMVIENKPFSLTTFIEGLEVLMRTPIETKGLSFIIDKRLSEDIVYGDEYRLRQVMVNLLGNALKFTEAGGSIVFSVKELEKCDNTVKYCFSVKDTGVGIKPEEQKAVFKAFEQSESGLNKKGGTGLGLAISSSIIAAMNSKIELESAPGKGSDFYFTLSLVKGTKIAEANVAAKTAVCFNGKRALLVEDNEINIEIAQFLLTGIGFEVILAINGQEAVDTFLASKPGYFDIIFMDIQMPVMDGLTATRTIRKNRHPSARTIPIIAMTANAFSEDMQISVEAGMNGHISKPIETQKLYDLLKSLLSEN